MTQSLFFLVLMPLASSFEMQSATVVMRQQSDFLPKSIQTLMEQAITEQSEMTSSSSTWQQALDKMEANLVPVFTALPKRQGGNLGPEAVRYLAYRYLLATHGLRMKGLQPCAHCLNASAPVWESVEWMKNKLPWKTQQELNEWRSKAIGLRDAAAIILALEHLVFDQGFLSKSFIQRAYKLNGLDARKPIAVYQLGEVVLSHFAMVLLSENTYVFTSQRGQKLWHRMRKDSNVGLAQHRQDRKMVSRLFPDTWKSLMSLKRKAVAGLQKERPGQNRFSFNDIVDNV